MTSDDPHGVSRNTEKTVGDKQVKTEDKPRTPGSLKGQISVADDFDSPMSEEELALWYDASIFPEDE
ncbi:MAG: hypothetical protein ACR65O_04255 [Methylomicrobium sp.]|jgi:hypothetical protein